MTEQDDKNQEARLRSKCKRNGLMMKKSRRAISLDNQGDFMLVRIDGNWIVRGEKYDMTLDDIEEYLKEE